MYHLSAVTDYIPKFIKESPLVTFDLQYPELLLLAIPVWYLYRKFGSQQGITGWLRFYILLIMLITVCGPRMNMSGEGMDVMVIADRSRSMPEDAGKDIKDIIQILEKNRGKGDRVGLVTLGAEPNLEYLPDSNGIFSEFKHNTNIDGSDLNAAMETALNSTDNKFRPTRILILSDGEYTGPSPLIASRRARELSVPIDYRIFKRVKQGDIAVESIALPESVNPREPFQFSVNVYAGKPGPCKLVIRRDGVIISTSDRELKVGYQQLIFRDIIEGQGLAKYTAEIEIKDDPIVENNIGVGMLRVEASSRILVLSKDGKEGNLARELKSSGMIVDVAKAENHPVTLDSLDVYRVVILENVPARSLGRIKMERLAQYVEDLGGGLMMTGGEMSFGSGGYFKSPLEEILPVSMEMRKEERKTSLALAVVLDRSGSMQAPVSGGKVKMDLANLGTAECIRMLSEGDSVSVIAVDSIAHIIQPLVDITDPEPIAKKTLTIQSTGGGIFIYEALLAAGKELSKAGQATKHIILFSDAQDSEEPGDYVRLLKKFENAGITVSVIGLGTVKDVDAELLKDIAKRGKGNIMFSNDPKELPRLFTEDTMSVARKSFITKDPKANPQGFTSKQLPNSRLFGDISGKEFPNTDGFNLSYIKTDATASVLTTDEFNAPVISGWYRGLGRVVAVCLEVDGKYTGSFGKWGKYGETLVTYTRWLQGKESQPNYFLQLSQQGQDAIMTLELDPDRVQKDNPPAHEFIVVPPGDEGKTQPIKPDFIWTGPDRMEARFKLSAAGAYRTLVKVGERDMVRGPVVSLPYSPEFAPRYEMPPGEDTLSEMASITAGKARTDVASIFDKPPHSKIRLSLYPYALMLVMGLLIVEIAGRRLSLWSAYKKEPELTSQPGLLQIMANTLGNAATRFSTLFRKKRSKSANDPQPVNRETAPTTPAPAAPSQPSTSSKPNATPATPPPIDIYAAAKNRAKKRQ